MEQLTDAMGLLDLMVHPAFCVKDGIIIKVNPGAAGFMIEAGEPVSRFLHTGAEEYAAFSDEELLALVQKELYVNEGVADATFTHKRLAEGLERAMYVCPGCGITRFRT